MRDLGPILVLLALLGGALTVLGGVFVWLLDEGRRIRRSLAHVLHIEPQPLLMARGRGVGVGFDLSEDVLAVTWDKGAWCLTYRMDELMGVELIVDRQVAARAFRGESRRPLDQLNDPTERVRLRFVFDDPGHPDFAVDLWRPADDGRRGRLDAEEALAEANRWMARIESLLRRPTPLRFKPTVNAAAAHVPGRQLGPLFEDDDDDLEEDAQAIT
jgi:hypothetical protein